MTAPTTPRKNLFRLILGIVAVVGIAAYPIYWLAIGHRTPAQTIYVAVTAEPAAWARGLRNAMAERLSRQGLEVVEVETPPSDLDWDGALAESEARGAHYLVHVTLTRDDERPGLTEGMTFAVATGELRVGPVDQEEASPSEPWSLTFGAEARGDATAAILETIPDFTDPFAHWAAGALFGMPALADIQIAEPANPLGAALDKKRDQDRSLAQYEAMCVESIVELTIDDERGPGPFTCLDVDCGERYLFGLSRDGRHALVHVDTPRSFVPFAMSPAPHAANTLERLVLVPLDGGDATTVATARSFYGHGTLSDDGSRAAFVEQAALRFGVVALEIATGARRVLSIAERPGMVIEARISPDGQWVAHHQKAFNRAHTELHVTRFDGAEPLVISRRTRDGLWLTAPLRPGENARQLLAFDGTESYEGAPRPALVDPAEPDDVVELDVGEHIVRQIVGAHDEKLVLLGSPRGDLDHCEIGIRDPETGDVEWRPIATCLEDTRMTDRFELTGSGVLSRRGPDVDDPDTTDPEAIVMDLETGQTTIHTTNRAIERNVHAAGNRIAFERRVLSQYPAVHPNAVCWTER
jgi:hypothetical protein